MLILAELTGKFGRVSIMAAIASLATRMIRASTLEGIVVGFGYILGGLAFDLLFFIPFANNFLGKTQIVYPLTVSLVSGIVASIPYLLFKLSFLGLYGFMAWIPINAYRIVKEVILSVLGVSIGLPALPRIKVWSLVSLKKKLKRINLLPLFK